MLDQIKAKIVESGIDPSRTSFQVKFGIFATGLAIFFYLEKTVEADTLKPYLRTMFVGVHGIYLAVCADWWNRGYGDKAYELAKSIVPKMVIIPIAHYKVGVTQPLFASCILTTFDAYDKYLELPINQVAESKEDTSTDEGKKKA